MPLNKISYLFLIIFFLSAKTNAQINWPAQTQTTKPWTRWWWEGSAVNKKDLTWNLEQYAKAGLGGVEVTPIYGVYGHEKEFINFLSPQWMQMFVHTLNESKRLGIGVDLANATGWPFGGPWVTDADASKTVYYKSYMLNAGESLSEPVQYKQEALVRSAANKTVSIDSVLQPPSKNKNLQSLALDQIIYPGNLPLQALIAYSDDKQIVNITAKVAANGKLNWVTPAGKWTLYALFVGLHGKMVERGAPGGEGYAIDHFSSAAANNYFKKFDDAFKGYDISYLRSFFNDSYEVDDARGQSNWTGDLFEEFKKRKGYDLRDQLPALFGKEDAEKNSRVIYDYRSVIGELLLERFTLVWKKWGASKGKMVRNQSHGSPANTLDLYSVVDIPETEGNDILRFKFATSAANVSGKKLVSSESATWLNEHFLSSLGDVKKAIDLYFLGGVNHVFYHGSAYSPKDAPWPGWLFYAAVHFQNTNPQWKDFHTLNEYIARVQSFLQSSKPDNDVLLYYPIVDRYSEPGKELLQHFDGMERNFENTDFEHISKWMLEKGYSFDFFSDRQLQQFKTDANGNILTGGNQYKTILLPANKYLPLESMQQLIKLAKNGARILFYKEGPKDVPGLNDLANRKKQFQALMANLHFSEDAEFDNKGFEVQRSKDGIKVKKAAIGKGFFYSADDMESLLNAAAVSHENLASAALQFNRRKTKDGVIYFVTNRSEKIINEWVPLQMHTSSVALFDPMTGISGLGQLKKKIKPKPFEVFLHLEPYQSMIIQTFDKTKSATNFPYSQRDEQNQEIKGNWSIDFLSGGPTIPAKIITDKLVSWTELGTEETGNFSGTAKYSISFDKPAGNAANYLLNLGKVNETAEVFLNGKSIATLIGPTFNTTIPAALLKQSNQLEIVVANLMANRITYMDKNNLPWKIFYNTNMPARRRENSKKGIFDASSWMPLPSGLLGPITLTALKNEIMQ
ncbi:MAG: glycosyl hydrolase [Ferruginibacter sp.]